MGASTGVRAGLINRREQRTAVTGGFDPRRPYQTLRLRLVLLEIRIFKLMANGPFAYEATVAVTPVRGFPSKDIRRKPAGNSDFAVKLASFSLIWSTSPLFAVVSTKDKSLLFSNTSTRKTSNNATLFKSSR